MLRSLKASVTWTLVQEAWYPLKDPMLDDYSCPSSSAAVPDTTHDHRPINQFHLLLLTIAEVQSAMHDSVDALEMPFDSSQDVESQAVVHGVHS